MLQSMGEARKRLFRSIAGISSFVNIIFNQFEQLSNFAMKK